MPLGVVYTKSKSIWDDITPFVDKLMAAYKTSQQTKWDNEWQLQGIADIEKANKPQQVNSFLEMQKQPKDMLDLENFKGFANKAVNMLTMKEMEMSPEDFKQQGQAKAGVGVVQTEPTQKKLMPDVKEFNDLFKYVSELPTGKVDWTDSINVFKKRLESGRAIGSAGQQFLQMILGQSMPTNQREKVQKDFGFAQDIRDELFPQTTKKAPNTELEYWLQEHPGKGVEDYWKAKEKPEDELKIDVMKFIEENEEDWELGSITSKGDFTIRRKDTTKKWDFDTYKEAQQWTKANPQEGFIWKIDPQPEGFNVSAVKKTATPEGGGTKLTPTFQTINSINRDLGDPGLDYDTTLHNAGLKYELGDVKLASKADQALNAYNMFEGIILDEDNQYIDEKGYVKDEEAYADYYSDYEKFTEIYFKETGKILPKKYLSIEEAGQYQKNQWALGVGRGSDRPVRNEDGIPWKWQTGIDPTEALFNEMQKTGTKPEDYDLEALAKEKGIDIERLNKLFGGGM